MWIRSQNKFDLVKTDYVFVDENEVRAIKGDKRVLLGEYKSEERALDVLNLIQSNIFQGTKLDYITSGGVRHYRDKVFEMPQL